MSKRDSSPNERQDDVPLFGSWRNAYFAVVAAFILEVALFYAFSRYFS